MSKDILDLLVSFRKQAPESDVHTWRILMPDRNGPCPLESLLGLIGGKWKIVLLWHVLPRAQRFRDLRRQVPGITQKMLTQQLRELERDGLVHRRVFAEVPPRVEYSATPLAGRLRPLLQAMDRWSRRYLRSARS
jgi:DNA-binding HxlR family transcriptional regulator